MVDGSTGGLIPKGSITSAIRYVAVLTVILFCSACGTSDKGRLKESRDAFLSDHFDQSEKALYTSEVFQNDQNRLLHYYLLASVAMSQAQYEKAIYLLNKARTTALNVRSQAGMYEWFSSAYRSNPIEFSYIHAMLVMADVLLAQEGQTPAWSTPEIKDKNGNVLVQAQALPARKFSPAEVADYELKARSELRAWDSFLTDLKRTYPTQNFYKEDLWARMLASFVHADSSDRNEKRTGELLTADAQKVFDHEFSRFPSAKENQSGIEAEIQKLKKHAQSDSQKDNLVVIEAGVMAKYKIKRFHLGLSTIFSQIKDPNLRRQMEQIGMQVLLTFAPEFGLVTLSAGVVGAIEGGGKDDDEFDGPPQFFTDAVDRSIGFEVRFPTLQFPPADTQVHLILNQNGVALPEYRLPVVSPVQEIVATELKNREGSEMFQRGVKIGLEYLAILIPAIKTYQSASRNNNLLQKIAVLAGYHIAKKAIDAANSPDLRSWDYLPVLVAADLITVKPGDYSGKVVIQNSFGKFEKDLGKMTLGDPKITLIRERVGDVPILNRRATPGHPLH